MLKLPDQSASVNYDSIVVLTSKLLLFTTIVLYLLVNCYYLRLEKRKLRLQRFYKIVYPKPNSFSSQASRSSSCRSVTRPGLCRKIRMRASAECRTCRPALSSTRTSRTRPRTRSSSSLTKGYRFESQPQKTIKSEETLLLILNIPNFEVNIMTLWHIQFIK